MTTATPFPTLGHALAMLDAFPISGALDLPAESTVADFDALDRARALLPKVWRADLALHEINLTPQGGVLLVWSRPGWALELTVDPFSLYDFRFDSPQGMQDWTRAGSDAAIADATTLLASMAAGVPDAARSA